MMTRTLLVVLLFTAQAAFAASPLVGKWEKGGSAYAELRADGSGVVRGEGVAWKADAKNLTLIYEDGTVEKMSWKIAGKTLTVVMDGQADTMTRAGGKAEGKGGKAAAKEAPSKAGGDKLSKLLQSSAWCHFRYNKHTGSSNQERVVFRRDGTWDSGARGETYTSGAYGSVAGQSDSASGGRWKTKGSSLLMSSGGGALEDADLSISYNSNGYPILKTGGKEYSSCN